MAFKFSPGRLVATPAAIEFMAQHKACAGQLLHRHLTGDWGDISDQDAAANNEAVNQEGKILSSYKVGNEKVWIITEADRSSTCILLPSEY